MNDLAGVFDPQRARALEQRLRLFEDETSHQIVVLTVPSLAGEPIEQFAIRVAETWALGHEGIDNGILVVVSPTDRRARVEVGYGLEGAVPDVVAARVLREHMIPRFREDDYAGGIEAGVEVLAAAASGEVVAARPEGRRGRRGANTFEAVMVSGFFGALVGWPFRSARRGRGGRWLGALVGGGVAGLAAFLFLRALPIALLAVPLGAALTLLLGSGYTGAGLGRRLGRSSSGGFGGWGRGGFGGGGFSGGGGGFGGGGASGSW